MQAFEAMGIGFERHEEASPLPVFKIGTFKCQITCIPWILFVFVQNFLAVFTFPWNTAIIGCKSLTKSALNALSAIYDL